MNKRLTYASHAAFPAILHRLRRIRNSHDPAKKLRPFAMLETCSQLAFNTACLALLGSCATDIQMKLDNLQVLKAIAA